MKIEDHGNTIIIAFAPTPDDEPLAAQARVFVEALKVYEVRNAKYDDNWIRMGWNGQLIRIRERAERLWDHIWGWSREEQPDHDDALDLINFSGFLVRGIRGEATPGGSWWED